ncbi:uncharacterized protein LOC121405491 [Drosophila obscura]|uniref:uncharacterized protein LOC121405491 n=1 Tax=Drosophila obscura TaxID=7282 RepID=UPI001BB0E864|nr:uncharacterized protein LOC121405491 [Drosophila obscura]XP_041452149.1 uncharacterized protein LOC121405491 [Drosophila obscura]
MMVDSSDNWSSWTTSCDSFTSMQPYSDNWSSCSWSSTSMQPSIGRYSNANELSTMLSCLSSDATATPSMGSCLSLNRTATPSMKSCLSPPSLSAQSTHSMVTCLTSDGHPTETKMPENGIPDNGWTSPMVAAISSLPIPHRCHAARRQRNRHRQVPVGVGSRPRSGRHVWPGDGQSLPERSERH